jgi:molecular chaperone GrpE
VNGADEGVKVTDKRRIDPVTGAVRETAAPAVDPVAEGQPADPVVEDTAVFVAEITADLQRIQAEYANYRKRVDRDREATRSAVAAGVLAELLPVLDDIGRAREHDELEGAFKAVGEALEATVSRLGLETFGEVGEPFDPTVHEALTHTHSDDVTEPTCVAVYQPGYRFAGRVVRPARVGVADPS